MVAFLLQVTERVQQRHYDPKSLKYLLCWQIFAGLLAHGLEVFHTLGFLSLVQRGGDSYDMTRHF